MKKIEAYLKPFRITEVRNALAKASFDVVRVQDAEELRPGETYTETVQGMEYEIDVTPRTLLVLVVEDDELEHAIDVIQSGAQTDHGCDGRILVSTVDWVVPVDPGEREAAS